jgi:hypothetical protein
MADFVQSANVKSAVRTLANSIADVAAFNTIVHSVICAAVLFMHKLIQRCMRADTDAAIDAFGKNGQVGRKTGFGRLLSEVIP